MAELTDQEQRSIDTLRRIANIRPGTLSLVAINYYLEVVTRNGDGSIEDLAEIPICCAIGG